MRLNRFLIVILLFAFVSCIHATESLEKKEDIYAPVGASLCQINQKVASHFLISGIPDGFNEAQYKTAVREVCYSNPVCKSRAETIFDSYGIDARKIDDVFSVMLCDKGMNWKIMEDFSCNNMRVEVQSWRMPDKVPCRFEDNWQRIKEENCNR
jgi:hypothetical protein